MTAVKKNKEVVMILGDMHIPYHDPHLVKKAANLYLTLLKQYSHVTVIQLGDLVDQTAWSRFTKDPDMDSPQLEWERTVTEVLKIQKLFPELSVIIGNHDCRVSKKAVEAGIPTALVRTLEDVVGCEGWEFHKPGLLDCVAFVAMHGDEMPISGTNALGAARVGNNLVYGHTHQASIQYSNAFSRQLWQMNAGCLIDQQAIAFRYAAKNPQRCWLGIGLIELDRNGNSFPILVPANHL